MITQDLVPTLQRSIGPVIVISGVGLILLSMTNRFGRVIDRTRATVTALRKASPENAEPIRQQLDILRRRARTVRTAITFASTSLLLAAILIISLFLIPILDLEQKPLAAWVIVILFSGCMLSLIASLVTFIIDINQSLAALEIETDFDDKPTI